MRRRANPQKADLGKAIVLLADLLGMTQSQLAAKIRMHDGAISDWCHGVRSPSQKALQEVLKVLGCSWRDLEEVRAFILVWRLRLERLRDAKQAEVDERSGPPRASGSATADLSFHLPSSPGLTGGPRSATDDERFREIGFLLTRVHDLMTPPPVRPVHRRR
ncbi:MAG TPA: helix-turn-helix transcriptional regulator [Thermoanaerobaculia bacterium]